MPGPSDQLFLALAQAKARPDKWARAVDAGANAGQNILGGYLQGKDVQQQLAKYKLLNTPLGQIFPDPSSIPGGLTPNHTVSDLLNMTPVLPYIPTEAGGQILSSMAGGGSAPPASAPSAPPPSNPPGGSTPLGGSNPPQPNPGDQNLAAIQGAGAGAQGNIPAGTPTTLPPAPSIARASPMDLQRFGPMMNDIRQGRQFQEGQANEDRRQAATIAAENARFNTGQASEESRFKRGQALSRADKLAQQQDEFNKAAVKQMSGFDALQQLAQNLNSVPPSQTGPYVGAVTRFAGSGTSGAAPQLASFNQIREGLIGNFAAALDPNGRQNQALLNQLEIMTPTVQDSPQARINKLTAMHAMLSDSVNRNYQGYNAAAQATGGNIAPPKIPSIQSLLTSNNGAPQQYPPNAGSGDPEADAAIQRIQSSGLNPQVKQARINAVRARMRPNG